MREKVNVRRGIESLFMRGQKFVIQYDIAVNTADLLMQSRSANPVSFQQFNNLAQRVYRNAFARGCAFWSAILFGCFRVRGRGCAALTLALLSNYSVKGN